MHPDSGNILSSFLPPKFLPPESQLVVTRSSHGTRNVSYQRARPRARDLESPGISARRVSRNRHRRCRNGRKRELNRSEDKIEIEKKANCPTESAQEDDDSDTSSSDDEDKLDIEEANSGILSVDWSDPALSEALIARIMEDKDIKRALYPPPGPNASTAKGGGKSKVESQWQLCLNLLEEHPKYKEALAAVTTKKERTAYANKIKNRLRAYV
ncbi:hypothetical protein B0H11DRAFT_2347649 [Mycena galericulata]|nr:hypothetical protein B0H11DRAFT_2347649 [Mycena galericulata]